MVLLEVLANIALLEVIDQQDKLLVRRRHASPERRELVHKASLCRRAKSKIAKYLRAARRIRVSRT